MGGSGVGARELEISRPAARGAALTDLRKETNHQVVLSPHYGSKSVPRLFAQSSTLHSQEGSSPNVH